MLSLQAFTFSPIQENTYLIYNDRKECCIIDPGCYFPEEREELKTAIEKTGLTPVLLLNTHCHLDHVFGNKFVFDTWGLLPHIHELEKPMLEMAGISGDLWQLPFENYKGELVYLREGSPVILGDDLLKILFTPGHSPGSVSFYYPAGGFVIAGDVLFNGSVGRTDLPGADHSTLLNSIREQLYTLPDTTTVWPGHGPATTIGHEKKNNPFIKG
ncbi:MAG: MBL fold metallo-hydrolase [Chitinophagaceae bacterium]